MTEGVYEIGSGEKIDESPEDHDTFTARLDPLIEEINSKAHDLHPSA
jgi:hypothetical protein